MIYFSDDSDKNILKITRLDINNSDIKHHPSNNFLRRDGCNLYQKKPSCLEVFRGAYGMSVKSTRKIFANELIDQSVQFIFIPNEDIRYDLFFYESEAPPVSFDSFTNSLLITETERYCNGYIGFINHHCTLSNCRVVMSNNFDVSLIANRDLEPHEELTLNYLLFDYRCKNHELECACGSAGCYKSIRGFANLAPDLQYKLIPEVTNNVLVTFLRDNYNLEVLSSNYRVENFMNNFCKSPTISAFSPRPFTIFDGGN